MQNNEQKDNEKKQRDTKDASQKEQEKKVGENMERDREMSNYMLHFALLLHVCSLLQALSLLLRMSQKVGSCRLHWLTVCLNTTALALVSKVTTDFNVVAELRS